MKERKPGSDDQDTSTRHAREQEDVHHDDSHVEEASEESFPASDAPSYTPGTSIGPDREEQKPRRAGSARDPGSRDA